MRLLFTADWQADFENLDLCQRAARDVILTCMDEGLRGFVVAGDLKRAYNPVDTRVVHFWMDFIEEAVREELKVVVVMGNHDRVGMYTGAQNWLPILQRAGATVVYSKPKRVPWFGGTLYCLPFSSSVETTRKWARGLAEFVPSDEVGSVLIFHNDVAGCSYNVLGHKSAARLSPKDLYPESYDWCFGGHVHLRQQLGGVQYIGNPFCSDWGEANQQKGYIVLSQKGYRFVPSSIPGWYDPSWPGFPKDKKDWKGCRVRIHVPIEVGQNYAQALDKARMEAERRYAGATIYTVPEFKEAQAAEIKVKLSDPDGTKIGAYVDETLPAELERHRKAIVTYLLYKLNQASEGLGLRSGGRIDFLSAKCKRFLSFEELEVDYREPGLRLIIGKNKDWLGRSNGSGKTNYQSPVPVALFGKTFKDQKHDAWAFDKSSKTASDVVRWKDAKGRVIRIERYRRPGQLKLFVDGKEQSSGLQSTAQAGTQGLIEKLSGFTWQTLANAVYIDQQQVNTFLSGTPTEQKRILERFQNLERFAKALEWIQKDSRLKAVAHEDAEHEKRVAEAQVEAYKESLHREPSGDSSYAKALERLRSAKVRLGELSGRDEESLKRKQDSLYDRRDDLDEAEKAQLEVVNALDAKKRYWENKLVEMEKAVGQSVCPTCLQPVSESRLRQHYEHRKVRLRQVEKKARIARRILEELRAENADAGSKADKLETLIYQYRSDRHKAEQGYKAWHVAVAAARGYEVENRRRREGLARQVKAAERKVKFWRRQLEILAEEQAIADYCVMAFSRNGVPAFLNAQLCQPLNRAAEHYAEVFTGKEIQVRFKMRDAEFEVEVVNAHGGKAAEAQSTGEKKMAGIVASFALRSIAPPCNLLVLDEPGDGLDASNAKAFAAGLRKLKDSLGTVLLTTHNPVIAGELSGEKCITIEKRGGVSRVA